MGFFKDFKEDLSQAVSDTVKGEQKTEKTKIVESLKDQDVMVNTLDDADLALEKGAMKSVEDSMSTDTLSEVNASILQSVLTSGTEEDDEDITDETAVITKSLSVIGDLNSKGSIDLLGFVQGSIICKGKLAVSGTIIGNSKASEVFANNAKIDGDIEANGSVKIGQGTVVVGNIIATSAVIAGAVKGDIDIRGPVIIDTSAIIVGDIKSKSVQINNGATIEGRCSQCYSDVNATSIFDKVGN